MSRTAFRALNLALLILVCAEVAGIVRTVVSNALPARPAAASIAAAASAELRPQTWQDRKVILDRNLFNVSVLAPTPVAQPEEDLEETKLPLKLLGTVAGAPEFSWAAVQDLQEGKHVVVRVGGQLQDRAEVERIERRCIVLQNGPRREKLCLEDDDTPVRRTAANRRATKRPKARRPDSNVQRRIQRLADERITLPRSGVEEAARNPASIFSQARILPKYEDGAMVGVQINSIKPGSMLEDIGLHNGDTISEFNGIQIESPEDSTEVLKELAGSSEFTVVVTGADGQQRTLTYELED
jgi:general secretion pathway protein C